MGTADNQGDLEVKSIDTASETEDDIDIMENRKERETAGRNVHGGDTDDEEEDYDDDDNGDTEDNDDDDDEEASLDDNDTDDGSVLQEEKSVDGTFSDDSLDAEEDEEIKDKSSSSGNKEQRARMRGRRSSQIRPSKRRQQEEETKRNYSSTSSINMDDIKELQALAKQRIARAQSERHLDVPTSPTTSSPHRRSNTRPQNIMKAASMRRLKNPYAPSDTLSTHSGHTESYHHSSNSQGLLSRLSMSSSNWLGTGSSAAATSADDDSGDNLLLMELTKKVRQLEKEKKELQDSKKQQELNHLAKIRALESGIDLEATKSQLEDAQERIKTLETQQGAWHTRVATMEKQLKDKQATIDQLRIEHPAPGVEPNVYHDLKEEVAAAHSLIQSQSAHIEQLSKYASFQNENDAKDLQTKISELQVLLAKNELIWKERIVQNSQDFRKQIDYWKLQANNWKVRFEQVWNDNHHQQQHQQSAQSQQPLDPFTKGARMEAMKNANNNVTTAGGEKSKQSADKDVYADNQARLLEAAMGKPNVQKQRADDQAQFLAAVMGKKQQPHKHAEPQNHKQQQLNQAAPGGGKSWMTSLGNVLRNQDRVSVVRQNAMA